MVLHGQPVYISRAIVSPLRSMMALPPTTKASSPMPVKSPDAAVSNRCLARANTNSLERPAVHLHLHRGVACCETKHESGDLPSSRLRGENFIAGFLLREQSAGKLLGHLLRFSIRPHAPQHGRHMFGRHVGWIPLGYIATISARTVGSNHRQSDCLTDFLLAQKTARVPLETPGISVFAELLAAPLNKPLSPPLVEGGLPEST